MKLKKISISTVLVLLLSTPAMAEKKVTILPFEVLSLRPEIKSLGNDISENITEALSEISDINATDQALTKNILKDLDIKISSLSDEKNSVKVGKYLEAELIVPGTVEFDNGKYKLNVKLVNPKTGKQIKQIELVSKDLFELQNKVAFEIINQQKIKLNKIQKERITKNIKSTKSIKALEYYNKGIELLSQYSGQKYDGAIKNFDKALLEDRSYFKANSAKIKAKALWTYEQKQFDNHNYNNLLFETEESINKFLKDGNGNSDIYKALSLTAYIHNDYEKGKKSAKKALEINHYDDEAYTFLWINSGAKLQDKNINKALKLNPISVLSHTELGKAYQKSDKIDDANNEYSEALKSSPDNLIINFNLAKIYLKTGRLDESIIKFKNVISHVPDSSTLYSGIAEAYRYKDRLAESIDAYKTSISLNPNDLNTHLNLGTIYTEQGELELAATQYQEVIRINPDNAQVHYYLGTVYKLQDKLDLSIKEYKEAIRLSPNFAEAHYSLGLAYKKLNKLEDAINEYKIAIKLNPKFPEARLNLGNIYLEQNKFSDAISEFKESIKIKPNYPRAYNNLGSVYQKQGKLENAITEYKQAIKLDNAYGSAYYNLSEIYKKQKKTKEALEELKKACKSGYKPACL